MKRWGEDLDDPTLDDLQAALAELQIPDEEHPSCWVSSDAGWCISAYGSGKVILSEHEVESNNWHMAPLSPVEICKIWLLLIAGDISSIQKMPWKPGYGNES